ncbi:flagellar motor switch protein FliM [bacterium]|nr:flagellar motor switch protein FliM [bacterium]
MPRLLSQEEIDALLTQVSTDDEEDGGAQRPQDVISKKAQLYDFKRPDRLSKDNIRSLHLIHDRFARSCSSSFSAYLRTMSEVNIISVDQFTYFEFLMSLPDPTCFNVLSMSPLEGNAALEINPSIVFPIVDRLLGGPGEPLNEIRQITSIEFRIIDGVIQQALTGLKEAWAQAIEIEIKIVERETSPQLIQIAAPNEPVVLISFEVKISDLSGMMNLCVPTRMIEPVSNRFTQDWHSVSSKNRPEDIGTWINELMSEIPLPVSVLLGKTVLPVKEILNLEVGNILVLPNKAYSPLTVKIADSPKFKATIGEHERKRSVRITSRIELPKAPEVAIKGEGAQPQEKSQASDIKTST